MISRFDPKFNPIKPTSNNSRISVNKLNNLLIVVFLYKQPKSSPRASEIKTMYIHFCYLIKYKHDRLICKIFLNSLHNYTFCI